MHLFLSFSYSIKLLFHNDFGFILFFMLFAAFNLSSSCYYMMFFVVFMMLYLYEVIQMGKVDSINRN